MLKIFEQIFHRDSQSTSYSDDLIHRATERAIDATDPRIRILASYQKKMRSSVVHAIDHIVQLVESFSEPVVMSEATWGSQPIPGLMFASADRLRDTISGDNACKDFVALNAHVAEPVTALLLSKLSQKHTYGYDLVDDKTMSDMPLTTVSFDEHRLTGLAINEAETRRLLQLRAFDYLLVLALAEITEVKELRQDLVARKRLLKTKLDIVCRSSGSLVDEPRLADRRNLQQKMDEVEAALAEAGADDTVLQRNLELVVATLGGAEKQLWLETQVLYIDNMRYLRTADHPGATELKVQILHDANAHEMAAQMVVLPPASLSGGKRLFGDTVSG